MTQRPKLKGKVGKITYWISTIWLALGMLSSGMVQLLHLEAETEFIIELGYPVYFLTLLGFWKILGVVVLLIPKFSLLKEWAYAGFFFSMSGAVYSHLTMEDPLGEVFPALLLLLLTMVSWYFRPETRKIIPSGPLTPA